MSDGVITFASKQQTLDVLAALTCGGPWNVSVGSSEPREALSHAAAAVGVGVNFDATKPEIAEAIASSGGEEWDASCDSRAAPSGGGSTVTLEGLTRVARAVRSIVTRPPITKQEALNRIAALICRPPRRVSVGSSEPREALLDIITALGLQVDEVGSKPELAESIAKAGGEKWDSNCDSRNSKSGGGSTVTLEGLNRVLLATATIKVRQAVARSQEAKGRLFS